MTLALLCGSELRMVITLLSVKLFKKKVAFGKKSSLILSS